MLTGGQQYSTGISQATRQPKLGRALPTPIRGGVDKRRPSLNRAPIWTQIGNLPPGVSFRGRELYIKKF